MSAPTTPPTAPQPASTGATACLVQVYDLLCAIGRRHLTSADKESPSK